MSSRFFLVATLVLVLFAALSAATLGQKPTAKGDAERGKYLVNAMGCADCHTPWRLGPDGPEPDPDLTLSGHPESLIMPPPPSMGDGPWLVGVAATNTAWAGPWGVSFTANLTPDEETGLGRWTEQEFVDTIRSGRHLGRGREILPPMPWFAIRNLTDQDLLSVFAHLKTLPPIRNRVPQPVAPPEAK
jgi:cytochrome c553